MTQWTIERLGRKGDGVALSGNDKALAPLTLPGEAIEGEAQGEGYLAHMHDPFAAAVALRPLIEGKPAGLLAVAISAAAARPLAGRLQCAVADRSVATALLSAVQAALGKRDPAV